MNVDIKKKFIVTFENISHFHIYVSYWKLQLFLS